MGCVESHPAATSPGWSQTRGQRISPRIRDKSVKGPALDNRKYSHQPQLRLIFLYEHFLEEHHQESPETQHRR